MAFKRKKVPVRRTLGKRLREARTRKGITLEEAEAATKIRLKYLEALEKDNLTKLPPTVYTQGFVSRYAEFLEIPKKQALGQFKAEGGDAFLRPTKLAPEGNVKELRFALTPQTLLVIIVVGAFLALLTYIGIQVKKFSAPPPLEVASQEEAVTSDQFLIKGKTLPYARLTLNGQLVALDDQGNFSELVNLQPGLNSLELVAQNRAGKETKRVIKVLYEPPVEEIKPEESKPEETKKTENINQ